MWLNNLQTKLLLLKNESNPLIIEKYHGNKNDFYFVDSSNISLFQNANELREFCVLLCERNAGLGADGVIFWRYCAENPNVIEMLIVNSDGTLAATCGNALRCTGLLAKNHHIWNGKQSLSVKRMLLKNVILDSNVILPSEEEFIFTDNIFAVILNIENNIVTIDMGLESNVTSINPIEELGQVLNNQFPGVFTKGYPSNAYVNYGNLHFVLFNEVFNYLPDSELSKIGNYCQTTLAAALSTNLNIAQANIGFLSTNYSAAHLYKLTVFERGAGLTMCCGSGATAARAALEYLQIEQKSIPKISFQMPGGMLDIEWNKEIKNHRTLVGAADFIIKISI